MTDKEREKEMAERLKKVGAKVMEAVDGCSTVEALGLLETVKHYLLTGAIRLAEAIENKEGK